MNEFFTGRHQFIFWLDELTKEACAKGLVDDLTPDPFAVLGATSPFPLVASLINNFWDVIATCHAERTGAWPSAQYLYQRLVTYIVSSEVVNALLQKRALPYAFLREGTAAVGGPSYTF